VFLPCRALTALTLGLALLAGPLRAEDLSGPFLAARQAAADSNYAEAARWYRLAAEADPANKSLLHDTVFSLLAAGQMEAAVELSGGLDKGDPVGAMVRLARAASQDGYQQILDDLTAGTTVGPLIDGLSRAWSLLGLGQMSEAVAAFDALSANAALRPFGLYHKALALASVGDFEGALATLDDPAAAPLRDTRRVRLAEIQILSQLERNPDALKLLADGFGPEPEPGIAAIAARLKAGEVLPFTAVDSARDGIAEAFFTVAQLMNGQATDSETLVYARVAAFLRPGLTEATLTSAALLERVGQHDLAAEAYAAIGLDDPAHYIAELGRADVMAEAGRGDEAAQILDKLAGGAPDLPDAWLRLGDLLRREDRFSDAVAAYDKGIAALGEPQAGHWGVYYARGICHERLKDWPKAEADFRKALELRPDQPDVLNYMGYSFLERKENLDEALSMIERAVKAEPENGAIVDSLGWALFRAGRYDEAVVQMERAAELMPVDPVVNDHLGDAFWAVGRKREAEFQWKRALSFKPDTEEEATRIRRKLEVGLDAVLAEEGAPPLRSDGNGG